MAVARLLKGVTAAIVLPAYFARNLTGRFRVARRAQRFAPIFAWLRLFARFAVSFFLSVDRNDACRIREPRKNCSNRAGHAWTHLDRAGRAWTTGQKREGFWCRWASVGVPWRPFAFSSVRTRSKPFVVHSALPESYAFKEQYTRGGAFGCHSATTDTMISNLSFVKHLLLVDSVE